MDVDSPGGTGFQIADVLGRRVLQRSAHVGQVENGPVPYWSLVELLMESLMELLMW